MEKIRAIEEDEIAEDRKIISEPNWSERVEDLVAAGDVTAAISFLESLVTNLQSRFGSSSSGERTEYGLQLAAALTQLADLYSSQGLSLKSNELRTRSSLIKQRALDCDPASTRNSGYEENQVIASNGLKSDPNVSPVDGKTQNSTKGSSNSSAAHDSSSDDDWEALADLEPSKLLSVEELPEISKLAVEEPKVQGPTRRGRGTFTYKKDVMYSDRAFSEPRFEDSEDADVSRGSEKSDEALKSKYGTRHVLVLADFSPSLRTTDLEKLFKDFDSGFIIRWVNDTTALAVFKTPSAALEACNQVQCSFTIRILDDHDSLLGSISGKDLEPPSQRPKTSARTAQRLIAHSMGFKLPASGFGAKELRDQEAARKNRIVSRQKLRDDAWGDD